MNIRVRRRSLRMRRVLRARGRVHNNEQVIHIDKKIYSGAMTVSEVHNIVSIIIEDDFLLGTAQYTSD